MADEPGTPTPEDEPDPPPQMDKRFVNPHADNPEAAAAYEAGYLEGAFGSHSQHPPESADEQFIDLWTEGNAAGLARFRAYRMGFRAGIEAGLSGHEAVAQPNPAGERADAWIEGRDAGLRHAADVASTILAKALATEHFEAPSSVIHSYRIDSGWLYWQEFSPAGAVFAEVPGDAYALEQPVYETYQALGSFRDALGRPVGSTEPVGDARGRHSAFQHGEIYWTQTTGAHALLGKIGQRWAELGGHTSYLGYPTSSRLDELVAGGWATTFEHGDIFHWGTSVIDVGGVTIRYRGLNCFGDTDESGEDEPYPILTVLRPAKRPDGSPNPAQSVTVIGPEERAVGGGSYPRDVVLYRNVMSNVGGVIVSLMEHDEGDKNKYRAEVEGAVRATIGVATTAIAAAVGTTVAGLPVSALIAWAGQEGGALLTSAINSALGTDDDWIGDRTHTFGPKALIEVAATPRLRERDIEFHFGHEGNPISGDGGSYKAYFDVDIYRRRLAPDEIIG